MWLTASAASLILRELSRHASLRRFAWLEQNAESVSQQPSSCGPASCGGTSSACARSPLGRGFSRGSATCRGGRFAAPSGTLRLRTPGRSPTSAGGCLSPPGGRFLRTCTPSTPSRLCCCARHRFSNAGCGARDSFCNRVQNGRAFLLVVHVVISLGVSLGERHTESRHGSMGKAS